MKIFLDTNIFIEYIEERKEVDAVEQIDAMHNRSR